MSILSFPASFPVTSSPSPSIPPAHLATTVISKYLTGSKSRIISLGVKSESCGLLVELMTCLSAARVLPPADRSALWCTQEESCQGSDNSTSSAKLTT